MRVLVTRPPSDAVRTADKLAARGHEAVLAPVTEISPTGEPMPAGPFAALIATSTHGAAALARAADRTVPVFTVGERTARATRNAGFASVTAAEGDAVSLARLIQERLPAGLTLLHAAGRHRKEEPAASLSAAGFQVVTWNAYEATALDSLPLRVIEALRTGQIGAALHYSRRSAELFLQRAEEAGASAALRGFPHLCLSADVAAPLRATGVPVLVAEEPSEDALLGLLERLP